MKIKKYAILLLISFLGIYSCKKERISAHETFIGTWFGSSNEATYMFTINSNGRCEWEKKTSNSETFAKGKFGIKGDKLSIGIKKFTINEYPKIDSTSGLSVMSLDNVSYIEY